MKMFRQFTHKNTKTLIDVINDLLSNYNNSIRRFIMMTPIETSQKENGKAVYNALFPEMKSKIIKSQFKVGDRVRISKKRKDFAKEIFTYFYSRTTYSD